MNGNTHRNRGMSLVELITALFILSVGVFGIVDLYLIGLDKTRALQEYALAETALDNEIETLRAKAFVTLEPGDAQPFQAPSAASEMLPGALGNVWISLPEPDNPHLKALRLRFEWRGEHGRRIAREAHLLIADKE